MYSAVFVITDERILHWFGWRDFSAMLCWWSVAEKRYASLLLL